VSLSNLQRQTIHSTASCGTPKVESASAAVKAINPGISLKLFNTRLNEENGDGLVSDFDVVVDGSDNFDTRYGVADLCEKHKKILVTAAVGQFDASITTLKPHDTDETGTRYPRYRDVFPNKPAEGVVPSCQEAGIIGALTGVVGSLQAMEVIKEITGTGESLAGRLLLYDAKSCRWQEIAYQRS